jgi:hypothetical protein
MKSSIAMVAALVLASLAFIPGTASARGGGHGSIGTGQIGHGGHQVHQTFFGGHSYSYGWGYGRGWCYWHPYACYRNSNR